MPINALQLRVPSTRIARADLPDAVDPAPVAVGRAGLLRPGLQSFIILVVLLLSFQIPTGPLLAQSPVDTVIGARWLTPQRVRDLTRTAPRDSVVGIIYRAYAADGFLNPTIELDSARRLVIDEGKRYRVSDARIVPSSVDSLLRRSGFSSSDMVGRFFSTVEVEEFVAAVLDGLGGEGYPLASASVDPEIDDDSVTVGLLVSVVTGDRVVVGEIDVAGSEGSRDLITLASGVRIGQTFTPDLADDVQGRIRRLNLYASVDEPRLYRTKEGKYGLLITVTEGNANTFDGVVGFQPGTAPGENGVFTGFVNVVLRNAFGAGRKIAARLDIPTRGSQEIELRYGEPFIFRLPIDVEFGFRQRQEEETPALTGYVERSFTGDAFYSFTDAWAIRVGGTLGFTLPLADSTGDCSRQLLNSRTLASTVGIIYDSRSNVLNPVSGLRYSTSYTYGGKELRGSTACVDSTVPTSDTRQRVDLDVESYLPLPGSFVLASGLHFGQVSGEYLEENDLYYFGGQSTVRGLRENLIRASRRLWGSGEIRFILSENSFAAIFVDAGYYSTPPLRDALETDDWTYGFGVGAQIDTPLGVAKISFALGEGDTFETGKVFIGLVNQF